MKKILSLLVLLVTTLSAFALDFTDYRKVTLGSNTPTESNDAKLSITNNGDGTYNVTFNDIINKDAGYTDKYRTFTFSNVPGSQTGDFTTVTGTNLTGTVTGGEYGITAFTDGELSVKFKEGKAYATMVAKCALLWGTYTFNVVFGTDEGFDGGSTGGGTVTEKYTVNFDKTAKSTHSGRVLNSFSLQQTGKEKQTESVSVSRAAYEDHTSKVFTVEAGSEVTASFNYKGEWMNGYVYIDRDNDGEFSYKEGQWNQEGTDLVAYSFYTTLSNPKQNDGNGYNSTGASVTGNARSNVNPPAFTAPTEPGTYRIRFKVDWNCILPGGSNDILSDGGGVWDATLEVVAAAPTVNKEVPFTGVAFTVSSGMSGTADVTFKEMSDETVQMTFSGDGYNIALEGLAKDTDTKGRTTYTGKVAKDTQTYDVAGVVYEKDNVERLYMTMITGVTTVVVGENPDVVTPEVTEVSNKTYTSNLRILDGETTVVEEAEANVNIVKYYDESYKVTLKNVNMLNKTLDLVFVGKAPIEEAPTEATEPLTIIAKSDEATTTFFGEQVSGTFEITEVSADEIKMGFSMESQNFSYQGEFNYTEEEEPEVYTSNLHIYDAAAPETDLFQADQAKVEFLATETGEFKLTLKDVTLNEKKSDLVFTGALPTPQPGGQDPLAEEGEGEVTPAEPAMVLNATADEATATFLGTTSATAVFNVIMNDEAETENDAFALTFTITAGEKTLGGEFNYKKKTPDTPDPELFCKENYVADGEGFEWDINVDWDTQKIVMSIDPSTCTGSCEDVIGLGAVPTAWDNTLHLYRTSADQQLQGYFQTSAGNNNTGKFAETAPFLVEVSKAQGFVVNNEVKIASSAMSYLFTLSTVKMGTGEGANDKSRATYNYVKVVDKDWTAPKDPDTGINATTVAEGEVEFFTVNGVKLNKLQKGLNIVRTADGKVKKVLVK